VRSELECTAEQRESLDALLRKHNRALLAIRDVSPSGADETVQPALAEIRAALKELLRDEQRVRLQGITLQAQGYDALLRKEIAEVVRLSEAQQTKLAEGATRLRAKARELQQAGGDSLAAELKKLQAERHKEVVEVLSPKQEETYGRLLGEPFDF